MRFHGRDAKRRSGARLFGLWALAMLALATQAAAGQSDNPLTPAPPRAVHKITRETHAEAAPIPPEKIIASFATHEDEYIRANTMYGFKRSVHLEAYGPDGQKFSEIHMDSEVYLADNGKRYERHTKGNTDRYLDLKTASIDAEKAAQVPLFPLVSSQMHYYDLTYEGSQPLDELHTYIFQVKPKQLLPRLRLFSGLIYVDDQDLAIVQVYGKWVALGQDDDSSNPDTPFSLYEMYYENIDGRYWFPTYIRSEAYVHTKDGDDRVRLTVRMTDFQVAKPVAAPGEAGGGAGTSTPATAPANPQKPAAASRTKPPA